MFNTPRVLGGFPILALHPKSLRQIREVVVWVTNSGSVYEPLMGGSFFVGNREGIEALAKPIFVRGVSPFYGSAPRTLQWLASAPCALFIQNHCAKSGTLVFRNGLRKRVRTSHMGGSFCVGNGEGIEVLAKPIFVRGYAPSMAGAPCAWPARLVPGCTPFISVMAGTFCVRFGNQRHSANIRRFSRPEFGQSKKGIV